MLQLAQHRPAEHIGQEDIERHRGGLELLGEIERLGTAGRDQDLEPLVAGEINQHARIMRIVLDNQENCVPRLEIQSVVRDLLDDAFRCRNLQRRRSTVLRRGTDPRSHRRPGVFQGQIEDEGTALAGGALQMNFAAQEACKLAADGEP